ncbi:MAG: ABC transporter permease [Proteobacteria bacterium]|nr:ABC transporter permease [Pseudomonadota bacterium]
MTGNTSGGRLSTLAAAAVIARRDFFAILLSRSFVFFLLGPLFPLVVGALAGGVGAKVQASVSRASIGLVMTAPDAEKMIAADLALKPHLGGAMPELVVLKRLAPGESADPAALLKTPGANLAAVVSGTPAAPRLTGPKERIEYLEGPLALVAAQALGQGASAYPPVALAPTATSTVDTRHGRVLTAQAAQTLLFLLIMLLAGMVMSNLVEEKANKIIEILAAAIPMDAVFLGKLFAMLAVSLVGIAVWGLTFAVAQLVTGHGMPVLDPPAVGWAAFIALGIVYFAMGYLLLGAVFLTIGAMATTVREVQTLSMPATMMQLLVFFVASFAVAKPGGAVELGAAIFPFSSPFVMLARAATDEALWTHAVALGWQMLCVALFVRVGARLFRSRVMKSGPAGGKKKRGWLFRRAAA